ncbi:MAG: branched-chain amino acid transaminase [Candidatus Moranbacteria bacterium]|nr:branched-chain amino acid transaminase [Candidatus Moranbacteria bacterium]
MADKKGYIWMDGKFTPFAKAQIHVLNHSLHYGSAVFEGIRCYMTPNGPAVFRLQEHIGRLFHSAQTMGMKMPFTKKQVAQAVLELVKKNKLQEGYIRPIVFYGEKMGLDPAGAPVHLAIVAWPWGKYLEKESVSVKISSFARIHPGSSVMTAKISGHYANSIVASLEAKKAGFDEALLLDWRGNIAEGPGENIFFVKNKTLYTPKAGMILPGLTRDSVMVLARELGYKVAEKDVRLKDLPEFDEAFFVGTAAEINAIGKIDGHIFGAGGEGIVTGKIRENYARIIHGENKKYKKWLSYVK